MNEYIKKLENELSDSRKLDNLKVKKYNLNFENWISEKKKILSLYAQFLKTMDLIPDRGIIEFDKGYLDSVLPFYSDESKKIMITKYIQSIKNKKNFVAINGDITVDKNVIIQYGNFIHELDFINFYITQLPISDETLNLLIDIGNAGKNIFIGTYGNLKDQDKDKKLKKLYDIKNDLCIYLNRNVEGEIVYTKDYYLAAITPKYKVNVKK